MLTFFRAVYKTCEVSSLRRSPISRSFAVVKKLIKMVKIGERLRAAHAEILNFFAGLTFEVNGEERKNFERIVLARKVKGESKWRAVSVAGLLD